MTETMTKEVKHHCFSKSLAFVYAIIGAMAIWIVLMPWVPAIARASMRRFQLVVPSFAAWAMSQPMPSMYSFANTFDIRDSVPDHQALQDVDAAYAGPRHKSCLHRQYVNHYPGQVVTFGEVRLGLCRPRELRWVVTSSTYRGQRVVVVTQVAPDDKGGFEVLRCEVNVP